MKKGKETKSKSGVSVLYIPRSLGKAVCPA